jgi:threonine/homoserine/homoserine lactone efflux protein
MSEMPPLLLAGLTGLLSGFLASMPVGPTNVTIFNEGARRGLGWALLVGLGSVTMEVTYCAVALTGFSGLFGSRWLRALMQLASFLLVLFLGLKYLLARSLPPAPRTLARVEQRLHPHTAFMTGFVRVLGNPSVLLFWIALTASFIAHQWIEDAWPGKGTFLGGVAAGALTWFGLLGWAVSHGHRRFSEATQLRMAQLSGASLVVVALILGARLVILLAQR